MTPAARHAANNLSRHPKAHSLKGTTMRPDQAQAAADQLAHAIATDDQETGEKAAMQLLGGIAVNIARIAEHLTKDKQP